MKRPKGELTVGQMKEILHEILNKLDGWDNEDEIRYIRLNAVVWIDDDFWDKEEEEDENNEEDDWEDD